MKKRIVFTSGVCDTLLEMGEELLHVRPDLKDSSRNVFVFKDSETFAANLDSAIKEQLLAQGKKIY